MEGGKRGKEGEGKKEGTEGGREGKGRKKGRRKKEGGKKSQLQYVVKILFDGDDKSLARFLSHTFYLACGWPLCNHPHTVAVHKAQGECIRENNIARGKVKC